MTDGPTALPPRPARAASLSCPNCGSPVTVRASGLSVTAACQSCGAVLDVANAQVRIIAEAQARTREPAIAIGTRATLAGTEWEVVGYQRRSSEAGSWEWEEYLLFNPYRGFRFLGEDHGHWTLYGMLRREVADPVRDGGDGLAYRPGDAVTARTDYVLGEFYWRVRVGDTVAVREFVHPPFVLTEERAADEVTWSRGRYLEPAVVQAAFAQSSLPARVGRAGHQPPERRYGLLGVAAISLAALFALSVLPFGQDRAVAVLTRDFTMAAGDQDRTLPGVSFPLPDAGGNLRVEATTRRGTGVLQLDVAIVPQGGQRQDAALSLGSLFDEGQAVAAAVFAAVPGGAATLLVRPHSIAFEPGLSGPADPVTFSITLRRHVPDTASLVLAALAVLAWPVAAAVVRWMRRAGGPAE